MVLELDYNFPDLLPYPGYGVRILLPFHRFITPSLIWPLELDYNFPDYVNSSLVWPLEHFYPFLDYVIHYNLITIYQIILSHS